MPLVEGDIGWPAPNLKSVSGSRDCDSLKELTEVALRFSTLLLQTQYTGAWAENLSQHSR